MQSDLTPEQILANVDGVLAYIEANPDAHDQSVWGVKSHCGTSLCIAGTAVVLDPGTEVRWLGNDDRGWQLHNYVYVDGETHPLEIRARDLLGLSDYRATEMFFASNNWDALDLLHDHRDRLIRTIESENA